MISMDGVCSGESNSTKIANRTDLNLRQAGLLEQIDNRMNAVNPAGPPALALHTQAYGL